MKRLALAGIALLSWARTGFAQDAASVIQATGIDHGLVVHLGVTDGTLETAFAKNGKFLAHGLAPDLQAVAAARSAIAQQGLEGVATVEAPLDWNALPYADNLANLVIVDCDALASKAPSDAEILRITAPYGAAYVRRSGAWSTTKKAVSPAMDTWTHYDHGADRNTLSRDSLAGPRTGFQWLADLDKDGEPYSGGLRIDSGRIYYANHPEGWNRQPWFNARDAFNGLPLWRIKRAEGAYNPSMLQIAWGGWYYSVLGQDSVMVAYDGKTGAERVRFNNGGKFVYRFVSGVNDCPSMEAVIANGTLLQVSENTAYVLDARTGALRWKFSTAAGEFLAYPAIDSARNLGFFAHMTTFVRPGRWPQAPVKEIYAFNLADGSKPAWTNTELAGKVLGQIVPNGKYVGVFTSSAISGANDSSALIGALDIADGHLIWKNTKVQAQPGYHAFWRDNTLFHSSWSYTGFDPATGNVSVPVQPISNQGCMRGIATPKYQIFGSLAFQDRQGKTLYENIDRFGCAMNPVPAYGMVYLHPIKWCSCVNQVQAYRAHTCAPVGPRVGDALRLRTDAPASPATVAATTPPGGPIGQDWTLNFEYTWDASAVAADKQHTVPVALANGKSVVAAIHQQRLDCLSGSAVAWSFHASGRITRPPVEAGGKVYFGSQDGWVYALDENTGALAWRFLAARNEKKIVAYGQLESPWPVPNVVLSEGKIVALAGRVASLDGGIEAWGLDPASGQPSWHFTLYTPADVYTGGNISAQSAGPRGMTFNKLVVAAGAPAVLHQWMQNRAGDFDGSSTIALDPANWNGKTIDYRTSKPVSIATRRAPKRLRDAEPGAALDRASGAVWIKNAAPDDPVTVKVVGMDGRQVAAIRLAPRQSYVGLAQRLRGPGTYAITVATPYRTLANWTLPWSGDGK